MAKHFNDNWDPMTPMAAPLPLYLKRIKKETADACVNPPPGIFTALDDQDITLFHAIIIGPENTPYEGGFFYFIIRFPQNYPFSPPKVKLMTTGGSKVRFNPNLYASGKVCLSILGTWTGPEWSAGSTIATVLISIQSLLNEEPYQNEPGRERMKTPPGYNQMLAHETMRVAVVGMLDNDYGINMPQSLQDVMKREFVKRFSFYESLAKFYAPLTGKSMKDPAYHTGCGKYEYKTLLGRLNTILSRLNKYVPSPPVATVADAVVDLTDCDEEPPRKKAK